MAFGDDNFFFPHVLCYKDQNGEFLDWVECRDQPNSGKLTVNTERELIVYKSLIFVPSKYKDLFEHSSVFFIPGAEIQVREKNGFVRRQGFVIQISKDEGLNEENRIWI